MNTPNQTEIAQRAAKKIYRLPPVDLRRRGSVKARHDEIASIIVAERAEYFEKVNELREALGRITRLLSDDNATARIIARAALAAFEEKL